jgi:hypothetical protein
MKHYFIGRMVYWCSLKFIIFKEVTAATVDAGTVPMDSRKNNYDFLIAVWYEASK